MSRSYGIRPPDSAPSISLPASFSVSESIGSAPITVTRSGNLTLANTVPYTVIPITASVADYTSAASGVLIFAVGDSVKTISNSIVDDLLVESTEQYLFILGADDATWVRGNNACIITINDNDIVAPSIIVSSITSASASEGSILRHTVTLSATTGGTFSFVVGNNTTSNTDYMLPPTFSSGVILIGNNITTPNGVGIFTVDITSVADSLAETNETYTLTIGGASATGTIVNVAPVLPSMTVATVSSPTAAEGANLVFTITLSGATQQAQQFPFTVGGTATANADYGIPLTFSNSVMISGSILNVPIGVSSFTATTLTATDALVESTETVVLTIGGIVGTGSITNVAASVLSAITRMAAFETPYGMLSAGQQTATATSGGYITACASRSDTSSDNYAIDISTTGANGTYTRLLDNRQYSPYAEVINVLSHQHADVPFVNEFDLPTTLTANTFGLMQDANGLQEFGLYSTYSTVTAAGASAKVFTGSTSAIFDTTPINIVDGNTAKIFLLNNLAQDTTLRTNGTTVHLKFIPKLGATEYTGASTPVAVTIASRASKPPQPKNVLFGQNGDLYSFPGFQFDGNIPLTLQISTASRDEAIPTGFFNPTGLIDSGMTAEVDMVGANGVFRTKQIPLGTTNSVIYTAYEREVVDAAEGAISYKFYTVKAGVRSIPFSYDLQQENRNAYPQVNGATATLSGANVLIVVTFNFAAVVPYLLDYTLGGTVFSSQSFGTITCNNGVTLMTNQLLQIPVGATGFTMTVPTISASGKILTTAWGADSQFPTSTTI